MYIVHEKIGQYLVHFNIYTVYTCVTTSEVHIGILAAWNERFINSQSFSNCLWDLMTHLACIGLTTDVLKSIFTWDRSSSFPDLYLSKVWRIHRHTIIGTAFLYHLCIFCWWFDLGVVIDLHNWRAWTHILFQAFSITTVAFHSCVPWTHRKGTGSFCSGHLIAVIIL